MIGDPLQILSEKQNTGGPAHTLGILSHVRQHFAKELSGEVIDEVVPLSDL